MKRKWLIVVGVVLAVVVAAERYGRPVMAEVRAALVQNVDEPGRNPFAFSTVSGSLAQFSVPAGKRYVVQQFTAECVLTTTPTTPILVYVAGFTNGINVVALAPASVSPSFAGESLANGTGTTPLYADPGSSVFVYITDTAQVSDCAFYVSGYVINNP